MLDLIVNTLKQSGFYGWEVSQTLTEGWEFYFIRHELDQNRAKNVEHIKIKVYQPSGEGFIGSATAEVAPTASPDEVKKLIADLGYRATLVKNKIYTLNPPREGAAVDESADLSAISGGFISAMRALPETAGEDVNSYEIFVSSQTRRLITSTGIDVTERAPRSMLEAVVNARTGGHEIELYRNMRGGACDKAGVTRTLTRAMAYGRDRLIAQPTPALGTADVLFSGDDCTTLCEFFADRMNAAMIARRMSDWEVGKPIAEGVTGDKVTLKALRYLENSSRNAGYDDEGAPIRDTVMIEDGVAREILGGRMFSSYLGLENSFMPTNVELCGGTGDEESLRAGAYLEAVEFSDFQVDPMTGDIFGELRLGYLHGADGSVTPVTGGSLSGSMFDFVKNLRMSRALTQYDNVRVPSLIRLSGVTVTGAAN